MNWNWQHYRNALFAVGILLLLFSVAFGAFVQQPVAEDREGSASGERIEGGEPPAEAGGEADGGEEEHEEDDGVIGIVRAISMEHSYTLLFFAVLTGILSRRGTPGPLRVRAQRVHKWIAFGAGGLVLIHILTQLEAVVLSVELLQRLLTGATSDIEPRMVRAATGVGIGAGATIITTVSALSFLRPRVFKRPFNAVATHTFAYTGFAFASIHSIVLGHESAKYVVFTLVVLGVLGVQLLWAGYRTPGPYLNVKDYVN